MIKRRTQGAQDSRKMGKVQKAILEEIKQSVQPTITTDSGINLMW